MVWRAQSELFPDMTNWFRFVLIAGVFFLWMSASSAARQQLTVDAAVMEAVDVVPPLKGAPFAAEATTEVVQTLVDGNRIVQRTTAALYRDSRGRTRQEVSLAGVAGMVAGGSSARLLTIGDPDSGMTYSVTPDGQVRIMRMTPGEPGRPAGAGPRSTIDRASAQRALDKLTTSRQESLGPRTMEGVVALGTRTTVTLAAGAVGNERPIESVSERWFAPDLGIVVYSRRHDPRYGETIYRLTKLARAEPAPELFERPERW
jgi:hypothetical protein